MRSKTMHIDSWMRWKRAGVLLLLIVSLPMFSRAVSQPTGVAEADVRCAQCHAEIYRKYLPTPMANASGPATMKLLPGGFVHQPSGIDYRVSIVKGQAILASHGQHYKDGPVNRPLSFFLGSGHLGTTYIYSINNFLFESPVAWYAASRAYDMKPGLAEMKQAPPSIPMQSSCLRCHMSAVQPSDSGTINRYKGLSFLHAGITCEACHGDAEKHVAAGDRTGVLNPSRLTADQRDSICISCHLEGDVTVERAGHSVLNYRPGESISTYLAFYVYGGSSLTSRGVSEVEQFAQSTCKRMSGDKMSCTSCHDPHFTPNAEQRTAFFRGKCMACHNQPAFAATHHPENQDCTSCHMSRIGAENIPHVAWTDHRILRVPESANTKSQIEKKGDLAPIFSAGANKRDLAMANYKAMLEGNPALESKAWEQLREQQDAIADDREALDAFGVISAEQGDAKAAEFAFRKALELDQEDLTALSDLGTLLARQGKLKEAVLLLQKAFERNQDISGLAMNLARVQSATGDAGGARSTLDTTLIYNPDLQDVRQLLTQLSDNGGTDGRQ